MAEQRIMLQDGAVSVYQISGQPTSVKVQLSRPRCPGFAACETLATAQVGVMLKGCLDQLGPVSYKKERQADGRTRIILSATGIERKSSHAAMCIAPPVKLIHINLGMGFMTEDSVIVEML